MRSWSVENSSTVGVTLWWRLSLIGCWDWAGMRKSAGIIRVPEEKEPTVSSHWSLIDYHWWHGASEPQRPVLMLLSTGQTLMRDRCWVADSDADADDVTLVDQLVEGVLSVGPGLAPHDWSSVVVDTSAIFGDVLPVRLHVALTTTQTDHMVTVMSQWCHRCWVLFNWIQFYLLKCEHEKFLKPAKLSNVINPSAERRSITI